MIAVDPRLIPLFRRSFPEATIIAKDMAKDQLSVSRQVSLGSIGQYLRKSWLDFARSDKYLCSNDTLSLSLRKRLPEKGRICGISWVSHNNAAAFHKSMRLKDLQSVLSLEGIHAVNLQYGDTLAERQSFAQDCGIPVTHLDDIDNFHDIEGLAALISACDVVVTVSNTTAHLAGALGKPTYLMVPHGAGRHWYWHENRDDSPWYPCIRIFRQTAVGDWNPVIDQVKKALFQT
jgi:ADP-heptose:LPS heptosyltransferase